MRVFLGNGPWYKRDWYGVRAGSRWPHYEHCSERYMPFPFFLAYATAVLEQSGYTCSLVDAIAERIDFPEFYRRIRAFRPDVVVLEVSTPSWDTDVATIRRIREELPQVKLVCVGLHTELNQPETFGAYPEIDYAVYGEYDYVLRDLVQAIDSGTSPSAIPGVVYRQGEQVIANPKGGNVADLDALPWPARHHLPMFSYHDLPGGIPAPSLQMWASRGCPFRCIFCVWPQVMYADHSYRTRDPKLFMDEVEAVVHQYGFNSFYVDDDTFNIQDRRIIRICEEKMSRRSIRYLPWAAMCRADTSKPVVFEHMAASGCRAVKFGVESANQAVVEASGKSLNLAKVEAAVKKCRELGINIHLTFTFGLPGETWETVRETIAFARRMSPDSLQYSINTPFPGSKYYRMLEEEGTLLTHDWSKYDGYNNAVVRTAEMSGEEIVAAHRLAMQEWERHKMVRTFTQWKHLRHALRHPLRGLRHLRHVRRVFAPA